MNIIFNTATNQVVGYTDYPDEFSALPDFVVCDIPDGWDESLRDAAEWVNGAIVINPEIQLSRMKSAKIDELSALRYQHETAGITLSGMIIETDRQSQALITGAWSFSQLNPAVMIDWKGVNGWIQVDAATIAAIAGAVATHVQACFSSERVHAEAIAALETREEVAAYDLTTGWPT